MNLPRIAVGLPDSMVFDTRHIRDKTERLGQIARALAIFQITDVIIYRSPFLSMEAAQREKRIIKNILGYLECPQYLRKALFPIQRDLEFVGLLPPLATPHHMVDNRLREGQYREALIFLNDINTVLANVGSKHPIPVNNPPHESLKDKKKRMVVKILKGSDKNPWEAEIVSREKVQNEFYWGFKIKFTDALLVKFQERLKEFFIIATDRGGEPYYQFPEKLKSLKNEQKGKIPLFLFGEPRYGLPEMLKGSHNVRLKDISYATLNTVPESGTRSIRLEEAVIISLSRLLPFLGLNK